MSSQRSRRDVLRFGGSAACVLLGGVSGCSAFDESPPSGSVVFDNRRNVPHVVTLQVTSGPGMSYDPLYEGGMSASLDAGERRTVASVFTEPGIYAIEGWLLSQNPATTKWQPETAEVELRPERNYVEYLSATVRDAGLLNLTPTAVG